MKFSVLNVNFNSASFDSLYRLKEISVRGHQIWVPPSKRAISATVDLSSMRTVADRDKLAAYHNMSTADDLSGGTNIDDLERP